jgi:hypothetical protein
VQKFIGMLDGLAYFYRIYQNNKDIETRPLTLNTDLEDSLLEMEKNEIK